jgi:hypothetical protein
VKSSLLNTGRKRDGRSFEKMMLITVFEPKIKSDIKPGKIHPEGLQNLYSSRTVSGQ